MATRAATWGRPYAYIVGQLTGLCAYGDEGGHMGPPLRIHRRPANRSGSVWRRGRPHGAAPTHTCSASDLVGVGMARTAAALGGPYACNVGRATGPLRDRREGAI